MIELITYEIITYKLAKSIVITLMIIIINSRKFGLLLHAI